MAAQMTLDQAGLSPGVSGRSRSDGLDTGALVTVTNTGGGSTLTVRILWRPPGDTTAVETLQQTSGTTWTFSPTPDVWGTYRIEMVVDEGLSTVSATRHTFGIRLPISGLLIPGANELAVPSTTLENQTEPARLAASETNEAFGSAYSGGSPYGWWPALSELFEEVETLATGVTLQTAYDHGNTILLNTIDNLQVTLNLEADASALLIRADGSGTDIGELATPDVPVAIYGDVTVPHGNLTIGRSPGGVTADGVFRVYKGTVGLEPVALANAAILFSQEVAGVTQFFVQPSSGAAFQIEAAGGGGSLQDAYNNGATIDFPPGGDDLIVSATTGAMLTINGGGNNVLIGAVGVPIPLIVYGTVDGGNGTAALPTFRFNSDPNTGMYSAAADTLGFSTNGTLRLSVDTTSTTSTLPFYAPDGATGTPSYAFANSPTSGFFRQAADVIGVSLATAEKWRFSGNSLLAIAGTGILASTAGNVLTVGGQLTTATGTSVSLTNNSVTMTGGAGVTQIGAGVAFAVNQTSTAAYTGLDINVTETGTGSGNRRLLDARVGGTSAFYVDRVGAAVHGLGAVGTPSVTFLGRTTDGFYSDGSASISMALGGTKYFTFDTSGGGATFRLVNPAEIRQVTPGGSLTLRGQQSSLATPAIGIDNTGVSFTGSAAAVQRLLAISATVNQTASASFTAFEINITQTAAPNTQLAIDVQTSSASQASLTQAGVWTTKGYRLAADNTYDIGTTAAAVKDLYIRGQVKGFPFHVQNHAGQVACVASGTQTFYLGCFYNATTDASPAAYKFRVTRDCQILNLRANSAANSASTSTTVTLYVNGVASALTVTITSGSTAEFTDLTHAVNVVAGDYYDWVAVNTNGGAAAKLQISLSAEMIVKP